MATSTTLRAPCLIFTGLNGSLLDQHSNDWQPALGWLQHLTQAGVPVIPATSQTRAELMALRLDLGLRNVPFIAENGAVIGLPPSWQHARLDRNPADVEGLSIKILGLDGDFLRRRLEVLRERMQVAFRCMSDMSVTEIAAATGLSEPAARLTRVREASEPLIWDDSDESLDAFQAALRNDGLRLIRGECFWHVMGDVDKGRAVRWLIARFAALRGVDPLTLGLGDGPNDVSLLETVARAVLIRGLHDLSVPVSNEALYRTRHTGPRGWAEGVEYWLGEAFPDVCGDGDPTV